MGKPAVNRAVFFDRDGVLNEAVIRDGHPCAPLTLDEFRLIDGVGDAVARVRARGWLAILVTNQPDLSRGLLDAAEHAAIMSRLRAEVELDDVYVCPDDSHLESFHKKPNPGMLLDAAERHGVDLTSSFMIGDTWKDVAAAEKAGCSAILIDSPYNQETSAAHRVRTLHEAVSVVLDFQHEARI